MRRYSSRKYTYTPTQGVKADFEQLLQRFTETGTVRFEKFTEIWKSMNFAKYCAGRQTLREAREFVEECLKIATQFWLPPSSFQVRAGALYLLYGLYNYQIATPKVKIRVTPENWKSILEFQTLSREQQHLDVDYVFQKLKLDRAFTFVATPSEFNPFDYRDDIEGKTLPDSLKDDESLLSELYSSQVLNQLAAVHDQYQKMKVALASDIYGEEPDTSLNIINNDLIQNIYRTLQTHKEKQTPHTSSSQTQQSTSQESASESEESKNTSLSVIGALKKKAFKSYIEGYKGRGPGRPPKAKAQDTIISLQDPKVNICGRVKGRAPRIDIFGKDEEVVIGPDISSSLRLVDMPDLDSILNTDREKSDEKKPSRKKTKKRGRSKSDVETTDDEGFEREIKNTTSDDEKAVKIKLKSGLSDDDLMDEEDSAYTDEERQISASKKSLLKKSPVNSRKKLSKKESVLSASGDETSSSSIKPPVQATKKVDRSLSSSDDFDEGVSPVKQSRKTARMSIENSDIMELKKLKSAKKSSKAKKAESKNSSKKLNMKAAKGIKGGKRVKKNIMKTSLTDEVDHPKDSDSQMMKSSSKKRTNVTAASLDMEKNVKSRKTKRKVTSSETDASAGKKMKKSGGVNNKEKASFSFESSIKNISKGSRKKAGGKLKKSLPKKGESGGQAAVRKEEPSAQERLHMKLTQRIKEKRLNQME